MRKYHRYILIALGVLGASSQANGQSVHTNSLNALSDLAKFQFNPASTPEGKRGIFGIIYIGLNANIAQLKWTLTTMIPLQSFKRNDIFIGMGATIRY